MALPLLRRANEPVLIDAQAHASLHVVAALLKARWVRVQTLGHSTFDQVARKLKTLDALDVGLLIDGINSMIGDIAPSMPFGALDALLRRVCRLHLDLDRALGAVSPASVPFPPQERRLGNLCWR